MFDEVEETGSKRALYRLREIFKYQNVIIYIVTLFISSISLRNGFFAFGLAMVAACVGEEIPVICTYACALFGTLVSGGLSQVQTFFVVSIIYFVLVLLLRRKIAVEERNEQIKTGGKLFAAGVIYSIARYVFHKYTFGELYVQILSFGIMYSFYKVFVNGIQCIKEFNIKKVFTIEEIAATGILSALFFASFLELEFLGIYFFDIAIFLVVMYISWRHGIINGIVCALAVGICLLFVTPISIFQIELLVVASIIAGVLSYLGKFAVLGTLIIAGLVLGFGVDTSKIENITLIKELCFSTIGLLFLPNRKKVRLSEILSKELFLNPSGDMRLREHKEPTSKKRNVMDMLSSLKNAHTRTDFEGFEVLVQDFLDSLECIEHNTFYELISDDQTDVARDICKKMRDNGEIESGELVEILNNHNQYIFMNDEKTRNDIQEIVDIANRSWKVYKDNNTDKTVLNTNISTRIDESGKSVWAGVPLNNNDNINEGEDPKETKSDIENVVDKLLDDIDDLIDMASPDKEKESNKETSEEIDFFVTKTMMEKAYKDDALGKNVNEIIKILASKKIKVEDCIIRKIKNGKYIVDLKFNDSDQKVKKNDTKRNIEEMLSKNLKSKIRFQKEKFESQSKKYFQQYSTEDNYVLQVGTAKHTMDGQNYSIDSSIQIRLNDGKYLLAFASNDTKLNDYRELNKSILKTIKQNTIDGFDERRTPLILDSELNEGVVKDSRVDVVVLDLFLGNAHILKNNTTAVYVKNKKSIYKLDIEKNMTLADTRIDIKDGDILIVANKGILESSDNTYWMQEALKEISTNNVQKMADIILDRAIDNSFGITHDDMVLAVVKIVKR